MRQTGKDTQEPRPYLSYLLRLWQAGNAGRTVWRASLESVQSGDRLAFAGLEALFEHLRTETGREAGRDLGGRARPPRSTNREGKGGDDADSVDREAVEL